MQTRPVRAPSRLALLLVLGLPALAWGQLPGEVRSAPLTRAPVHLAEAAAVEEPPARIAAGFGVEPLARLLPAQEGAADLVDALAAWNRAGRRPLRTGIVRALPVSRAVPFDALADDPAGLHAGGAFARVGPETAVWGAAVEVEGAHRLRLHLEGVDLPAGTRLWVYGEGGRAVAFGPELAHEGSLWTPSVHGPVIRLEVELPREALAGSTGHGFEVDRVAQIFRLGPDLAALLDPRPELDPRGGAVDTSCLIDATCVSPATFSVVDLAALAIAHIQFTEGAFLFACTGGLLNVAGDAPAGLQPPFLTANHCLSTDEVAASLEAFWDYKTLSCDGPPPSLDSLPRTNGSDLLATSPLSDFTLLALDFPAGRILLGWNAEPSVVNPLPPGTETHRLSHPVPESEILPQQYTRNRTLGEDEILRCGTDPEGRATDDLSRFHHSVFLEGGTFGGSSGAPLILDNGQVVGQLFAACGPAETVLDGCSMENDEIDGNFFTTFELAKEFLGVGVEEGDPPTVLEVPVLGPAGWIGFSLLLAAAGLLGLRRA